MLNPVRAHRVPAACDWPWSSYGSTAGDCGVPDWLSTDWLLSAFGPQRGPARQAYREFVERGRRQPLPWSDLKQQIYLGDERFVARVQARLDDTAPLSEVPATQRRPPPKPLSHYAGRYRDRDAAIAAACLDAGHPQKAIGEHFGLHYSMVSRIVKRARDVKRNG